MNIYFIIYNISIFFYGFIIRVASLCSFKASLWIKGRTDFFKKINAELIEGERPVWIHCASLGEFEQGRPVIEKLKAEYKEMKILLTFFSPSGYELRKNYEHADCVLYLPADTPANAERFVRIFNPRLAIFVKYEYWLNYLNVLHRQKIPVVLISAVFRKEQHFFKWYGKIFREALKKYVHIFLQDENSMQLLKKIGVNNTTISGDTRFDRVAEIAASEMAFQAIDHFSKGHITIVAGSTWPADEAILIKYINSLDRGMKFIIAPHQVSEQRINQIKSGIHGGCIRLSELEGNSQTETRVLIIDSVGVLSRLYRYGKIAYIGGGFGKGIHNILEPAAYGMPVIFGPRYQKFREAQELIIQGGAFTINGLAQFIEKIGMMLSDEYVIKIASEISRNYVRKNKGATAMIVNMIVNMINPYLCIPEK